jgi:hypothetical protein
LDNRFKNKYGMKNKLLVLLILCFLSCKDKNSEQAAIAPLEEVKTELDKPKTLSYKNLKILSGKFQIQIPKFLNPMDEEMFKLKYPFENFSKTIAYSDENETISLLVSPRDEEISPTGLLDYQKLVNDSFENNPQIDFISSEIKKINEHDFIIVEMITPAGGSRVYNKMFVTSLNGQLVIGTFNCTIDQRVELQPIADHIIDSLTVFSK